MYYTKNNNQNNTKKEYEINTKCNIDTDTTINLIMLATMDRKIKHIDNNRKKRLNAYEKYMEKTKREKFMKLMNTQFQVHY